MRTMIAAIVGISLFVAGCGGWSRVRNAAFSRNSVAVMPLSNEQRAVLAWTSTDSVKECVEPVTPVALLQATTIQINANSTSTAVPVSVNLGYGSSQSADQVYSVGDTLQFMHEALFRLCEAYGNGAINSTDYQVDFSSAVSFAQGLLNVQLMDAVNQSSQNLDAQAQKASANAQSASAALEESTTTAKGKANVEAVLKDKNAVLNSLGLSPANTVQEADEQLREYRDSARAFRHALMEKRRALLMLYPGQVTIPGGQSK